MHTSAHRHADPLASLLFAKDFEVDYTIQPGVVRYWRGMTGRIYTDRDGWFDHPDIDGPFAVRSAWFWDGPMTEVDAAEAP